MAIYRSSTKYTQYKLVTVNKGVKEMQIKICFLWLKHIKLSKKWIIGK
jgi:hypothetical protein